MFFHGRRHGFCTKECAPTDPLTVTVDIVPMMKVAVASQTSEADLLTG
jgi:hypothetical protein